MYEACVVFADISGFTPLTEKMAAMGPEGVEKLTAELNKYFDLLIGNVYRHGGDIIKFAGDALLVIWPAATKEGLADMILLACQCAKALLDELHDYQVPGTGCTLRLHIGIGAGQAGGINVGGVNNRVEFFISGQTLEQVSSCEKQAAPGEAFVSAIAWMLLKKGKLVGTQKGNNGVLSNYKLEGIKVT
jgi:class 3 adenylate cyclase